MAEGSRLSRSGSQIRRVILEWSSERGKWKPEGRLGPERDHMETQLLPGYLLPASSSTVSSGTSVIRTRYGVPGARKKARDIAKHAASSLCARSCWKRPSLALPVSVKAPPHSANIVTTQQRSPLAQTQHKRSTKLAAFFFFLPWCLHHAPCFTFSYSNHNVLVARECQQYHHCNSQEVREHFECHPLSGTTSN